jgi:hypothetical protein
VTILKRYCLCAEVTGRPELHDRGTPGCIFAGRAAEPAPTQCLDAQERNKLDEEEERIISAAWEELEALLVANERRHLLAAEDPYRIPEGHDFEVKQWARVRLLFSLSCGVEPDELHSADAETISRNPTRRTRTG